MTLQERFEQFLSKTPEIDPTAYVAASAEVIGDVHIGPQASVWPKCVIRGDINSIRIGEGTNIQDASIIHLSDDFPVIVKNYVTVGHGAILHACAIEDECLIGMRATVLDGAVIGKHSIIGANTLVPKNMEVPPGSLVLGIPGRIARALTEEEQNKIRFWAEKYIQIKEAHRKK